MNASQLTAIVAIAIATPVFAQEGVREKIHDLKTQAEAAQAAGHPEEAEKLRNAARELASRAQAENAKREGQERERPNREQLQAMLEQSRRELDEAARAGKEDRMVELKQRIARLTSALGGGDLNKGERAEKRGQPEGPEAADAKRRLQHLGEAIEQLRLAGMDEPADRLAGQAREMKRQLASARDPQRGERPPEIERQVAELREGMMNLQRQMQEMQKRLEELSRERR
jgi:hypothetical protein